MRLLAKLAVVDPELQTPLLPHQLRVLQRLHNQPGLVVAHGLGTGKTLSSIAAALQEGGGKTTALVPASLQENYKKEIAKHVTGDPGIDVRSQQGDVVKGIQKPSDLLIVDEAHRARETSSKLYQSIMGYPAKKRMLLTATPVYNRPSDIAPLVNMAAGARVLPTDRNFNDRYVEKPDNSFISLLMGNNAPHLKNTSELKSRLDRWVDYDNPQGKDFPSRIDETLRVPMNKRQTLLHDYAWDKLPLGMRIKLRMGMRPTQKDLPAFNKFESQTRQIAGSTNKFDTGEPELSPKLQLALDNFSKQQSQDPNFKAVVYSNFLNNLDEYGQELEHRGVPYQRFTGNVSKADRAAAVQAYNEGKIKALLVSSAGGEGLDLKGTKLLQVLEPHWNEEKLNQVIGRAIRHGSHSALPEQERNVRVQKYLTHPRAGFLGRMFGMEPTGVEDVLDSMSQDKQKLNQQLINLLQQH